MDTLKQFLELSNRYINICDDFISTYNLSAKVKTDHLCFKCKSSNEFNAIRDLLEINPPSKYSHQVFISKRRVSYYALSYPLILRTGGSIAYLEIADKKPGKTELTGFHHAELFPLNISYDSLLSTLSHQGLNFELKRRPHHTTHDLELDNKFVIRLTDKPLIQKIASELTT